MPVSHTSVKSTIQYSPRTLTRAERAVRCSPFQLHLFQTMLRQSVSLRAIAATEGFRNRYTSRSVGERAIERQLQWLIQTGVLRREVDGQGITDSFRLTPLGRQLVDKWEQIGRTARPSWLDYTYNAFSRWFRLPAWLS